MVPTLFEGMDNSVSRKAVVANVLSLQLVLYVKFLVAAAAALGGGFDNDKPLRGNL